jgi:putative proteasome-type protease
MFDVACWSPTRCAISSGATASTYGRTRSASTRRSSSAGRSPASRCLFRIYAEGNFIAAGADTPYFQTGETKYGKPIIDRVITRSTPLADATKCVLVSFDSTMRSNLSVGMPIDLICYERDTLAIQRRRRFDHGDPYFTALSHEWSEGTRQVFRQLPELVW